MLKCPRQQPNVASYEDVRRFIFSHVSNMYRKKVHSYICIYIYTTLVNKISSTTELVNHCINHIKYITNRLCEMNLNVVTCIYVVTYAKIFISYSKNQYR